MAPSVVQAARNAGTGTTVTVTLGSATTAGSCLVALVATAASTNGSVSGITLGGAAGNWAVEDSEGTGSDHAIVTCWSDPNCAGGQTSVVISTTGSAGTQTIMAWVLELSGMPSSGPLLDKSAKLSSAGFVSSWSLGPTATTTQASEVWLGIAAGNVSGVTPGTYTGPSSPWSNEPGQGVSGASFSFGGVFGHQVVSSTGTASYNGSVTPSSTIEGLVLALKAASGTSHPAAAALAGSGSLTAAAAKQVPAAAALSGSGTLTASAVKLVPAAATLSGSGALTAAGAKLVPASAPLSGSGTLTAGIVKLVPAGAALSGSGTLTAAASKLVPAGAALSGAGSLTAGAVKEVPASASLSGAGSLTAAGVKLVPAAAAMSGSGSLNAAVVKLVPAGAALSGSGTLTAAAGSSAAVAALLSGSGTLTAGALKAVPAAASLSGLGALTAAAAASRLQAAAALSGSGTLTASASAHPAGRVILLTLGQARVPWSLGRSRIPWSLGRARND